MIAMDQFLDINIKPNKGMDGSNYVVLGALLKVLIFNSADGMMLALGIVGALSSFLFLTDLCYAISNLNRQKSQKRSSSPAYPTPSPRK